MGRAATIVQHAAHDPVSPAVCQAACCQTAR
jgi:hypothetical protein